MTATIPFGKSSMRSSACARISKAGELEESGRCCARRLAGRAAMKEAAGQPPKVRRPICCSLPLVMDCHTLQGVLVYVVADCDKGLYFARL